MTTNAPSRWEFTSFLILYTTDEESPIAHSYEMECTKFKALTVTISFEGSENYAVDGQQGMKLTLVLKPFSRAYLGRVHVIDRYKRSSLKMSCDYTSSDPSPEDCALFIQSHKLKLQPVLKEAQSIPFPPAEVDLTDEQVHQVCQNYGKKFIDKDFLPTVKSIYKPVDATQTTSGGANNSAIKARQIIEWKRAADFMDGAYHVFEGGIEPGDIKQGALGNCWFLCAVAALTEFPQLVLDLIETKEVNEHGVYRVRFCKNGWWQSVRVDDFFPCFPHEGPIYSRSNGNELWVMLLEKAFSKICGSYEAIRSGRAYEGMMDMTGAPCKTVDFDEAAVQARILSGEAWKDLLFYDKENYIMSASSRSDAFGLVANHAYTLVSAKQTSNGDQIVKLRNPWGDTEWTGDWSDSSPLWTESMQREIERIEKSDDGMFWMSFKDLVKHFNHVDVCMVRHKLYHPVPWVEKRSRFCYNYDFNELTPQSQRVIVPSYLLTVPVTGEFVIEVHQQDKRCHGAKEYIDVGVSVKRQEPNGKYTQAVETQTCYGRQYGTGLITLTAGKYKVTPATYGGKLRESLLHAREHPAEQCSTAATASASSSAVPMPLVRLNDVGDYMFTDVAVRAYSDLFDRMDLDNNSYLSKSELDNYSMLVDGVPLQDAAFAWLLDYFEDEGATGLSKNAFIRAQQYVFQHTGADEEKLRNGFHKLGYDANMKFEAGRPAVLSIHSTVDFQLDTIVVK